MLERSSRKGWLWLALIVALVLVVVIGGAPSQGGVPLDPGSTEPTGTKALVLLLEHFGAEVEVSKRIDEDAGIVLVLVDELSDSQNHEIDEHLARGGTLVVADPLSDRAPPLSDSVEFLSDVTGLLSPGVCDIEALSGVGQIEPGGGASFDPGDGQVCFAAASSAFVVAQSAEAGSLVSVGSNLVFTNGLIGRSDNALFATSLLAPSVGASVTWLEPDAAATGGGDRSLWDEVGPGGKAALIQLLLAAVVLVFWRSRRLGKPIREPLPARIAGSDLVEATGLLLEKRGDPNEAARRLRRELRGILARRFGIRADADPATIADAVAARSSLEIDQVLAAIDDRPVPSATDLVSLVDRVQFVREEVTHGRIRADKPT